jgi:pilus assembly protein CpaB
MKPIRLVILGIAIMLGLIATYFGRIIIDRSVPVVTSLPTTSVVVAVSPLQFGSVLSEENVAEIPWPAGALPEGAFQSKAELLTPGRRVVLAPLQKNEPILNGKITGANGRASLAALLDPGMRAVTIRVDDVRGVAGFVRPNDRVDILLTQSTGGSAVADVLLKNVKVLATDQIANERQEGPAVAKAVTIEVNTEQAQKLVLAQGIGSLSLILRQPDAVAETSSRRVTLADLGGAEQENQAIREQRERVATLEQQIDQMRLKAAQAGEKERQYLLNLITQLEQRMASELRRVSERPGDKEQDIKPTTQSNTLVVRVTRGGKPEEYSVTREAAGTLVRSGQ